MLRYLAAALIVIILVVASTPARAGGDLLEVSPSFRAGAGYGITYGGVGVNFETALIEYVGVVAGIGATDKFTGYLVGVRAYPIGRSHKISPRIGVYRGIIGLMKKFAADDDIPTGAAVGLGSDIILRDDGKRVDALDLEIFVVDGDLPADYTLKGGRVKFAIGYSFRF